MSLLEVVPILELKILELPQAYVKGKQKAQNVNAWLVPGSQK